MRPVTTARLAVAGLLSLSMVLVGGAAQAHDGRDHA